MSKQTKKGLLNYRCDQDANISVRLPATGRKSVVKMVIPVVRGYTLQAISRFINWSSLTSPIPLLPASNGNRAIFIIVLMIYMAS